MKTKLTYILAIISLMLIVPMEVWSQEILRSPKSSKESEPEKSNELGEYSTKAVLKRSEGYQQLLAALENAKNDRIAQAEYCDNNSKTSSQLERTKCFARLEQLQRKEDSLERNNSTYYLLVDICVIQWKEVRFLSPRIKLAKSQFSEGNFSEAYSTLNIAQMNQEKAELLASKTSIASEEFDQKTDQLSIEYIWKATLCATDFEKNQRLDSVNYFIQQAIDCRATLDRYFVCGLVFYALGNWDEAIRFHKDALQLCTTRYSKAIVNRNLAYISKSVGDDKMVEKYGKIAIQEWKYAYKEDDEYRLELASAFANLYNFYKEKKRYEEGDKLMQQATNFFENVVERHPDCRDVLSDLYCDWGVIVFLNQEYEKTIAIYEKGLRHLEQAKLPDENSKNFKLAILHSNLALTYHNLRSPKAFEHYKTAIVHYEILCKADNETYARRLGNAFRYYGIALLAQSRLKEGHEQLLRSMNYFKEKIVAGDKSYYNDFNNSYVSLEYSRDSLFARKSWKEALAVQKERVSAITEVSKVVPNLANELAIAHGNLAWHFIFARYFYEAEVASRTAIEFDSTENWMRTNLGHALLYQGRYEEAIKVYQEFLDIGENSESTRKMLKNDWDWLERESVLDEIDLEMTARARKWLEGSSK